MAFPEYSNEDDVQKREDSKNDDIESMGGLKKNG